MLDDIVDSVRNYEGLTRKRAISKVLEQLRPVEDMGRTVRGFGEDCAVVKHDRGFLLLAGESIWSRLLEDPEWAGYCSVLANVNDVYSMGGRPLAVVNTMSFGDDEEGVLIARGLRKGAEKFRVPVVGGHVQPASESSAISVFILGSADSPMSSFGCKPGDVLIVAVDLDGEMRAPFLNFDSTSHKSPEDVLHRLEGLVEVADKKLASACKDISNPGVLGTAGMLLETSGVGAHIDIDRIPKPAEVDLKEWLLAYPGCGFVLATSKADDVLGVLSGRGLETAVVGRAVEGRRMTVSLRGESRVVFDFEREMITGASPSNGSGGLDE